MISDYNLRDFIKNLLHSSIAFFNFLYSLYKTVISFQRNWTSVWTSVSLSSPYGHHHPRFKSRNRREFTEICLHDKYAKSTRGDRKRKVLVPWVIETHAYLSWFQFHYPRGRYAVKKMSHVQIYVCSYMISSVQ